MNKAVIDIETGGFSIQKSAICEIGLIIFNEKHEEIDSISVLIKPYARPEEHQKFADHWVDYHPAAMEVNGLNIEHLINNGVEPSEACDKIEVMLEAHNVTHFIGHNIDTFDLPRLVHFFERFSMFNENDRFAETSDTMKMAKDQLNLNSYSLQSLCEYFEIINEEEHRAVGDSRATFEVWKNLAL